MKKSSVAVLCIVLLSGCATTVGFEEAGAMDPVGFWSGLWHGLIAPISWLFSISHKDIAIYAIYNNGGWYDFGYILGIGVLGSSCTCKKG